MPATETGPRANQRLRTRKDLLRAAARLLQQGRTPSMEDVAEEALVSRATAYRYFPSIDALLVEAPLDGEVPDPAVLFDGDAPADPAERVDMAEVAMHEMCYRNEAQLRRMLANSLLQTAEGGTPVRQNRRLPLIEAALAPARGDFDETHYARLCAALTLIIGTEPLIVFRDVFPLSPEEARAAKSWAVRALVHAALEESKPRDRRPRA